MFRQPISDNDDDQQLDIQPINTDQKLDVQPIEKSTDDILSSAKKTLSNTDNLDKNTQVKADTDGNEDKSTLSKIWDIISQPLTDLPSRVAEKVGSAIDTRSLNENPHLAYLKGFVHGSLKGLGNVTSSLSSPLNIALTASGLGESGALGEETIPIASRISKLLSVPTAIEGGKNIITGKDLPSKVAGLAELAGSVAGLSGDVPGGNLETKTEPTVSTDNTKLDVQPIEQQIVPLKAIGSEVPEQPKPEDFQNVVPETAKDLVLKQQMSGRPYADARDIDLQALVNRGDVNAQKELDLRSRETEKPVLRPHTDGTLELKNPSETTVKKLSLQGYEPTGEVTENNGLILQKIAKGDESDLTAPVDLKPINFDPSDRINSPFPLASDELQKHLELNKGIDYNNPKIEDILLKDILGTQKTLTKSVVDDYQKFGDRPDIEQLPQAGRAPNSDHPVAVKVGDKYVLAGGHHRAAADLANGKDTIQAITYPSQNLPDNLLLKSTETKPSVKFAYNWPEIGDMYRVDAPGHILDGSDVSADTLKENNIPVPESGSNGPNKPPSINDNSDDNEIPNNDKQKFYPESQFLKGLANLSSKTSRAVLGFHIPKTALSFHGINEAVRNTLFGENFNPFKAAQRFTQASYYLLRPQKAQDFLDLNPIELSKAVKEGGLRVTTGDIGSKNLFAGNNIITRGINGLTNPRPLFEQVIPALKLKSYQRLYKQYIDSGIKNDQAAKLAGTATNNIFGGLNLKELERNPVTQQLFRSAALAPDWLESNIRLGGNILNSIKDPTSPANRVYLVGVANFLGSYIAFNVLNALNNNGKFMYQNPTGHELDIAIGHDSKGRQRFLSPYGTSMDMFRLPISIAHGAINGNLGQAFSLARNRLSEPMQAATDLVSNSDYSGTPLYNKNKYGRPIPLLKQGENIGEDITSHMIPIGLNSVTQSLIGNQSLEQAVTSLAQLPLQYRYPDKHRKHR